MRKTLDASMLNLPWDVKTLAPLCAQHSIVGLSAPREVLNDETAGRECAAILRDNGLQWGLMPMPADFYSWELTDEGFEEALGTLAQQAAVAEKLGIRHAYNHVWSSGPRAFDENFDWHVHRVKAVGRILRDHGVHYGLEFLGPKELQHWQPQPFVHTLAGVLAIADAADADVGFAFDTFHWYCGTNGDADDLLYAVQHADRLVALHLNDAVAGVPYDEQRDMQRRLPMETGVIDSRDILARFRAKEVDALYMIEPFEPSRTRFAAMTASDAVCAAAQIFDTLEK